jgi:hypothetical protein
MRQVEVEVRALCSLIDSHFSEEEGNVIFDSATPLGLRTTVIILAAISVRLADIMLALQ